MIYVADCGKSKAHICRTSDEKYTEIQLSQLRDLSFGIDDGDLLIIEDAHIRARERFSLAQPFELGELQHMHDTARDRNITILTFGQKATPKARTLAGFTEKTDENDTVALARYVVRPNVFRSLKSFKPISLADYQGKMQAIWDYREGLNLTLNVARNFEYEAEGDSIAHFISENILIIAETLGDDGRNLLDFKWKPRAKAWGWNKGRLYTLVALILDHHGNPRLRTDVNKPPYWKFVKEAGCGMTPFHMGAGVAASNIKHHWRRASSTFRKCTSNSPLKPEEVEVMNAERSRFDKRLRDAYRSLRTLILK